MRRIKSGGKTITEEKGENHAKGEMWTQGSPGGLEVMVEKKQEKRKSNKLKARKSNRTYLLELWTTSNMVKFQVEKNYIQM